MTRRRSSINESKRRPEPLLRESLTIFEHRQPDEWARKEPVLSDLCDSSGFEQPAGELGCLRTQLAHCSRLPQVFLQKRADRE
jgi:hypothetical protein